MSNPGFVLTRAAAFNADACEGFGVFTYKSHKSRAKKHAATSLASNNIQDTAKVQDTQKGIDIKRARREIIKFGMTGFDSKKKQETKVALAVSLGAKPPKNEYKNYKDILNEKRVQKSTDNTSKELQQAGKNSLGVSTAMKKFNLKKRIQQKRATGGLLEGYGKPNLKSNNNSGNKKAIVKNKKRR